MSPLNSNVQHQNTEEDFYTLDYWNKYYAKGGSQLRPSTFAEFVTQSGYVKEGSSLLDVGCGDGRDTFHFLKNGIQALGVDGSTAVIEKNIQVSEDMGFTDKTI